MTITATRPDWQTSQRPDSNWARVVVPTYVIHHTHGDHMPVFVTIKWHDNRLSLTGVEGPMTNGDCYGSGGQITLEPEHPAPGWESEDVARLQDIWDRWHLNDMRAGSPDQEDWVREHKPEFPGYPTSFYDWATEGLAAAGLNPDADGYFYGHAWKHEDVPDDILDHLWSLPNTTRAHPWGRH